MKKKNKTPPRKNGAARKPTRKKQETYPHFRRYKVSNHPALIIGEQPVDEYRFRKVMHAERDGGRPNEKIEPNLNPQDSAPMYIGKRVRHDKKKNFDKRLSWKYPKK